MRRIDPFAVILAADHTSSAPRVIHSVGIDADEAEARFDLASVERLLANAKDGLATFETNPESLVYVARLLRAGAPEPRGYLVVGVSPGFGQPHDRTRSENAGFDEHLVKPVAVDTLLRSVAGR